MASTVQSLSSPPGAAEEGASGAAEAACPRWAWMLPPPPPSPPPPPKEPRGVFAAAAAARCLPVENSRSLGRKCPFLAEDAAAAALAAAALWKPSTYLREKKIREESGGHGIEEEVSKKRGEAVRSPLLPASDEEAVEREEGEKVLVFFLPPHLERVFCRTAERRRPLRRAGRRSLCVEGRGRRETDA